MKKTKLGKPEKAAALAIERALSGLPKDTQARVLSWAAQWCKDMERQPEDDLWIAMLNGIYKNEVRVKKNKFTEKELIAGGFPSRIIQRWKETQ